MTNMLHRVLWGRGYAEPQQIPLAIAGEEAEVMAVSGGGCRWTYHTARGAVVVGG